MSRQSASPQRLPSGNWRVQWVDEGGKRRSATFRTEAAAKAGLRRALVGVDDIRSGRAVAKVEAPVFGDFVERWMKTYPAAAGNRALTIVEKKAHVKRLEPHLADVRLDQVRGKVLDQLFAALHEDLSPKSVKNIRATLGTILRSAKKWGELADVPELPRVKVPDQEWDWYTAEESQALLAATRDPEERAMLLFALHTGARFGEQRVFGWGDLDWKRRLVLIRRSMPCNTTTIGPTKSGKERRVPMSRTLHDALKELRQLRHLKGGLVFGRRRDGGALSIYAMTERLQRAARKAGLREIKWHELRHSFASQLVSAGVPLRQVQEWLGHSTMMMTMRYSHLAPGGGDAIRALDSVAAAETLEKPQGAAASAHDLHTTMQHPETGSDSVVIEATPTGFEPRDSRSDIAKLPNRLSRR
jgi:integrase